MKSIIIDKRSGNAEVYCDEYGDYATFETYEAAEEYRSMYCDSQESYVFPRKLSRGMGLYGGIIGILQALPKPK